MKKINFKKFFPGLTSIVIIIGMAVQSFATNVDMAAFVKKDKYITKYYELDWRIDDIEKSLERLYKYTCTNVRSFAGSYPDSLPHGNSTIYQNNAIQSTGWYATPIIDTSEEGYLRFNNADTLNAFGNHGKTDRYEFEIPASLLKWNPGIELYPNAKLKILVTRNMPNTTAPSATVTWTQEIVMGPFKKFIDLPSTGMNYAICSSNGYFRGLFNSNHSVYYNYGQDTQPTSWNGPISGQARLGTADRNNSNLITAGVGMGVITDEQMVTNGFSGDKRNITTAVGVIYPYSSGWGTNLSNYDKLWIRLYSTPSGVAYMTAEGFTLTTWNYNK